MIVHNYFLSKQFQVGEWKSENRGKMFLTFKTESSQQNSKYFALE